MSLLKHVVASAAEAETAALFHNAHNTIPIRRILTALGHSQLPTPIKTDNNTAHGFVHNNIHLRKSKTWDMRYYWLKDKQNQNKVNIYWKKGKDETDPNLFVFRNSSIFSSIFNGFFHDTHLGEL